MAKNVSRWLPGVATVAVVLTVWWPFFRSSRIDNHAGDWLLRTQYLRYTLNAILHDRELPLWVTSPSYEQPRAAGVHEFFANPETDVLSLTTLFAMFRGLLTGTKLAFAIYLSAGALGARRLVRVLTGKAGEAMVSFVAPLLLALLALCNGSLVAKAIVGHTQFLTIALFPLALALMVESWDARLPARARLFRAALCGALLAVAYYAGNAHSLIHFLLIFPGLFALLCLLHRRADLRIILPSSLVLGGSFLGVAAFKLCPGLGAFHAYKASYVIGYKGWRDLARNLVIHWVKNPAGGDFPHELNLYVGWFGVAILLLAVTVRSARGRFFVLLAVAVAALAFKKDGAFLQRLPYFQTQGVFARFGVQALLAMAVAASMRVEQLVDTSREKKSRARTAFVALLACLAVGLAIDLRSNVKNAEMAYGVDALPERADPIDVAPVFDVEPGRKVRIDTPKVSANSMTYAFAALDGQGPPLFLARDLSVASGASHLRLEGSAELTEQNGRLAVRATDTEGTFTLRYANPLVTLGLVATIATCIGIALLGLSMVDRQAFRARFFLRRERSS